MIDLNFDQMTAPRIPGPILTWPRIHHAIAGPAGGVVIAALAMVHSAAPVSAQSPRLFTPPDGCTAFLTVQSRSCTVAHYYTCEGDAAGTHWRVALDEDGPFYLSFTDAEFRWLRNFGLRSGTEGQLVEPEEDPASLTELLETGADSMVFSIVESGMFGTMQLDYTGFDTLTGAEVEIDGRRLLITEFAYQLDTGDGPRSVSGNQFVHPEWRLFFGGIETTTLPNGDSVDGDYSPVDFAEPGEPGFLSLFPAYDCDDVLSGMPVPDLDQG